MIVKIRSLQKKLNMLLICRIFKNKTSDQVLFVFNISALFIFITISIYLFI